MIRNEHLGMWLQVCVLNNKGSLFHIELKSFVKYNKMRKVITKLWISSVFGVDPTHLLHGDKNEITLIFVFVVFLYPNVLIFIRLQCKHRLYLQYLAEREKCKELETLVFRFSKALSSSTEGFLHINKLTHFCLSVCYIPQVQSTLWQHSQCPAVNWSAISILRMQ